MHFANRIRLLFPLLLVGSAILLLAACGPSAPAEPAPADASPASDSPAATSPRADTTGAAEADSGDTTPESVVAVTFTDDRMTPKTIRVKQGDQVTLNLDSNRPGSFHIHGYDLQQEVVLGEVTPFRFVANATGRFRINFHGVAEPDAGMEKVEGMGAGGSVTGGHHDSGGPMDDGPIESSVPVSLEINAEADRNGGVHVAINTEGWRWAPEEVNGANSDGAGHAHVYADGVKLSRVYGNYYYIPALESGTREIKVSLNSNGHSELTWQGDLLESAVSVSVPEMPSMSHHDVSSTMDPVEAEAPMSLEVAAHEDSLGGYNIQVIPSGFEFSQSVGQGHEPGKGYALLIINGEVFNRLYGPWLQAPAQGAGTHTFTVALLNNEGRPYLLNGQPVEKTITVQEEAGAEDGDGATAGHHDSPSQQKTSNHHGSGSDEDGATGNHHQNGDSDGSGHSHGSESDGGAIEELEVGYLEVLP